MKIVRRVGLFSALIVGVSCSDSGDSFAPVDAGDAPDWIEATPEEAGLDSAKLEEVRRWAFEEEKNAQAIVIIKDGHLIAEWYADGKGPDSIATSWSVGKSFTSAVIGLLYDDGIIGSLERPMTDFFPEWIGTDKESMTLRDPLTMSSGLEWLESYSAELEDIADSDAIQLVLLPEPLTVPLSKSIEFESGTHWRYSSGDTLLLSSAIKTLTGKSATQIAEERLFGPLGMDDAEWWVDSTGLTYTWCCLDAPTRQFAKFGQLFLQEGVWGGQRILSEEWIGLSRSETAQANTGYGLQWWLNRSDGLDYDPSLPDDLYMALGFDGQSISVLPTQNMVIARNGLYIQPEGPAEAPNGLFTAGLAPDGMGTTGSVAPGGDYTDEKLVRMVLDALIEK